MDPHSASNIDVCQATHADLSVKVDFARKMVLGKLILTVQVRGKHIKLDVKDLVIHDVYLQTPEFPLAFGITPAPFGSCLDIELPDELPDEQAARETSLTIDYETSPGAAGILWLESHQSLGKKHPQVFTQAQAIQARSFWPCMDTPAIKATFDIAVTVQKPLIALCSGTPSGGIVTPGLGCFHSDDESSANAYRTFSFKQTIPVPSYLLSFACGNFVSADIGPISKVWTEPEGLDAAKRELDGVIDPYIKMAESVVGGVPYKFSFYHVLILPSNLAYGGMENPQVTNISKSLLAGDRSLTTVVCHEIVHAWSGNWTTNRSWSDFFLNEGFTRYIERRVLGQLNGDAYRGLLLTFGYFDLKKNVDYLTVQNRRHLTQLAGDLSKIDPDEAFSRIPYEKGSLFLYHLERTVCKGDASMMSEWLAKYFTDFAKKSISTNDFKQHFISHFPHAKDVDWDGWLYGEGLPAFDLFEEIDTSLVDSMQTLAKDWQTNKSGSSGDFANVKAHQTMVFLDTLIDQLPTFPLTLAKLEEMDNLYHFSASCNVEIAFRWWLLALKCRSLELCFATPESIDGPLSDYLGSQGRGVYVKPLYQELAAQDLPRAKAIFHLHRSFYMEVVSSAVAKMVQ
jgi:leukotriene-A4 hydrolase